MTRTCPAGQTQLSINTPPKNNKVSQENASTPHHHKQCQPLEKSSKHVAAPVSDSVRQWHVASVHRWLTEAFESVLPIDVEGVIHEHMSRVVRVSREECSRLVHFGGWHVCLSAAGLLRIGVSAVLDVKSRLLLETSFRGVNGTDLWPALMRGIGFGHARHNAINSTGPVTTGQSSFAGRNRHIGMFEAGGCQERACSREAGQMRMCH